MKQRLILTTLLALAGAPAAIAQTAGAGDAGVSGDARGPASSSSVKQQPQDLNGAPNGAPNGAATAISPGSGGGPREAEVSVPVEGGAGLFEQSSSAGGGGSTVQPTMATAGAEAPFRLNGYVRGDAFIGKVPGQQAAAMKAGYGELSLGLRTAKQTYGDGFAEARVRYGLQGDQQQTFLDLREAYANMYAGPVDLRLGRQIIVWGRADLINPTNNLTPMDLRIRSPIEDDRRLGNFGARAFLKLAPIRLEGVWIPIYLPSELPPVGIPEFVAFGPTNYPVPTLKNGLYAGRVHLELSSFEMSLSYLRGYAPLPGLTFSEVKFDPYSPAIIVSRTAYNQQVVGMDFSTAVGSLFAVRGEAAYRRPEDYANRPYAARPDVQYALGVDRSFGPVTVIAQYLGRYVFDWTKQTGTTDMLDPAVLRLNPYDEATSSERAFWSQAVAQGVNEQLARTNQIIFGQTEKVQHIATLRLEWLTAHETLSLSALGIANLTTKEWLAAPRIGYRLSDSVITYVGAEIFAGPDGTLFGLVQQVLSAGYAELRCTF